MRQPGCAVTAAGMVPIRDDATTDMPGLDLAGDASRRVPFAVAVAAEGAMAAFEISTELLGEDTR